MFARCSLILAMCLCMALPAIAQDDLAALEKAVQAVEAAIADGMNRAGQQGQPTLGQLGGVQSGSTGSDAGGGAGGSSGGSGGGSGGSSGGSSGGGSNGI